MEKTNPRLPEKGEYVRHQGVLIDIRTTQPPTPKPLIEYIFEERSARKELRFKDGTVLDVLETLNDFYGLGTGEEKAIQELSDYCKEKGIDANSDVEAFIVRETDHTIKTPLKGPNFYNETFFDFATVQRYDAVKKHEEKDVWSSKKGLIADKNPK
jgi:hypothetical protein